MINNQTDTLPMIREIANRIIPGCKILLFGSRARKDNNEDSDYDFLVITHETFDVQHKRSLKSMLRKELARFKIPADILIHSQAEIDSKKDITGHILKQVLLEGVAL